MPPCVARRTTALGMILVRMLEIARCGLLLDSLLQHQLVTPSDPEQRPALQVLRGPAQIHAIKWYLGEVRILQGSVSDLAHVSSYLKGMPMALLGAGREHYIRVEFLVACRKWVFIRVQRF